MRILLLATVAGLAGSASAQAPYHQSVYFDWNEFDLSASARAIVEDATRTAKACNVPNIRIVGHDDTSLSSLKAQEMSDQRAQSVRALMLNTGGVDPQYLSSEGRGDRELLLPTADGVKEPMNRRVEIDVICR